MRTFVRLAVLFLAASSAAFAAPKSKIKTDAGVDLATKTVSLAALNDESGPASGIGKPYPFGKRILARRINAGGSGRVGCSPTSSSTSPSSRRST